MNNTEIELAWAAGFFDGEGSCKKVKYHYKSKKGKPKKPNQHVSLTVAQSNLSPLLRFKAALNGIGHINGPYQYSANKRPYWVWGASCASANKAFNLLEPYLEEVKKKQFYMVMEELDIDRSYRRKGWIHDKTN